MSGNDEIRPFRRGHCEPLQGDERIDPVIEDGSRELIAKQLKQLKGERTRGDGKKGGHLRIGCKRGDR